MKTKNKVIIGITSIIVILIAAAVVFIAVTNRNYTVYVRQLPGLTALDGQSYIMICDLGDANYYDRFLHYEDESSDPLTDTFSSNYYEGILSIGYYYSFDCDYAGEGTQIDCDVIEKNKKYMILHYYGSGVTSEGTEETVDDYWKYNINELWEGRPTTSELLEEYIPV